MLRRILPVLALASLATSGCFAGDVPSEGGPDDDYMDDQPPPGGCQTDCPEPGSGGSPDGGPCLDTNDCASGICAAEFDGAVQTFQCQQACIPLMDEAQWCADDASCCEGGCSPRGFCLIPTETEGLDSGASDTGPETSSSSDTGGSSSGAGGSSSGSSTG